MLSRLHADGPDGLLYTLVGIAFVPNAVLLGGAYLLGPGFAVGAGTVVSPTAVVLGPLPAFPLLAALPDAGGPPPPGPPRWSACPSWPPRSVSPWSCAPGGTDRLDPGALHGLLAGLLAALALVGLVMLAGGAAGPGRMADVGADGLPVPLASRRVAAGSGGLVGGLARPPVGHDVVPAGTLRPTAAR